MQRTDSNQSEIVNALRAFGASVQILAAVGGGCPDLLVGYLGQNYLFEIKNLAGRGDRLTPAENRFFSTWRGKVVVIHDITEALFELRVCAQTSVDQPAREEKAGEVVINVIKKAGTKGLQAGLQALQDGPGGKKRAQEEARDKPDQAGSEKP